MANLSLPSTSVKDGSFRTSTIFGLKVKMGEMEQTHVNLPGSFRRSCTFKIMYDYHTMQHSGLILRDKMSPSLSLKASRDPPAITREIRRGKFKTAGDKQDEAELFDELKNRFLSFKRTKYLEYPEQYESLAKSQAPKFSVIACGDSRVCPSVILGFQPGEAFMVRNVANLVPPFESGPSETNAALEFSVNTLEVENILVIGHSCCGGIQALMSMPEVSDDSSSFIKSWVRVGKNARMSTKASASHLSFEQQCRHCEKESVNRSLKNLLTYPWIEERVMRGTLSLHGGYYDFVDCTFEKWTLDYLGQLQKEKAGESGHAIKNRSFWR